MSEGFSDKVVVVKTDGTIEVQQLAANDMARMRQFQDAVGGWIEMIRLNHEVLMYLNEEGAIHNLPANYPATELLGMFGAEVNMLGGVLRGDVVLVGHDGTEETVGIPKGLLQALEQIS